QAAHIIKENIRDCDIAARFGGEEFTVLLPMARTAEALTVGLRIGRMLEEFEFVWEGQKFHVTTSGGIASLDEIDHDEPEALLQLADSALYEAKQTGRNRVIVNRPSVEAAQLKTLTAQNTNAA
ncbi:MAG: GGDEF domain-containing protein, partial [Granulosicoccaceae bacterium]